MPQSGRHVDWQGACGGDAGTGSVSMCPFPGSATDGGPTLGGSARKCRAGPGASVRLVKCAVERRCVGPTQYELAGHRVSNALSCRLERSWEPPFAGRRAVALPERTFVSLEADQQGARPMAASLMPASRSSATEPPDAARGVGDIPPARK